MTRTCHTSLLALLLIVSPALAREPSFVTPQQAQLTQFLPQAPADGSETQKSELAELHAIETGRTPEQAKKADADSSDETVFLFRDVFGPNFTPEKLPQLAAFGKAVRDDGELSTKDAKDYFHRKRPYNADATLKPVCKTTTKDNSYPSGHAMSSWLQGLMLIDLFPERRAEILARAADYARSRLLCGVHYPSDLEASKLASYALHGAMLMSSTYQKALEPVRAEIAAWKP